MIRLRFWFMIVTLLGACSLELRAEQLSGPQREFLRSLELFDSAKTPEDFRASADVLEALVAEGFCSGAVYYNLGNAYYRAGAFGRAILNYRKAKPYRPQDPLLEANLQQSLLSAPGKLSEPTKPWWIHVLFWTESLSYPTRIKALLACLTLTPILAFIAVLFRRRSFLFVAGGCGLVGMLLLLDATLNSPERTNASRAVITGETIARKGIGKDYEAAFNSPLKDGAEFEVIQETNGWTFGHFSGIGDGWVRNEFIAR